MTCFVQLSLDILDIDECSNGSHKCDVNAYCTNTDGSHSCFCKEGFTGDGRSCSGRSAFTKYRGVTNVKRLIMPDFFLVIVDIDECTYGIDKCDVNANCTNAFGSHSCSCKEGFTGDGHSCSGILH